MNDAGFADAPCVTYYRTLRAGVGGDASQLGYGVNKRPVSPALREHLVLLHRVLLDERMAEYDSTWDKRVRGLVAGLAGEYLGLPGLDEDQLVFCHGTTEAISVAAGFAARRGLAPVLPLPVYYAFEQSALRNGLPDPVFYDVHGRRADAPRRREMLVDVAPNGVLGTWFARPAGHFRHVIVDHVFALPTFQRRDEFLATLRRRVRGATGHTVFLTPSKDLSLPGLRCGVLLTTDPALVAHARADRFERGYTVHRAVGPVAALHVAMLLLTFTPPRELSLAIRRIRTAFTHACLPFPRDETVHAFLAEHAGARELFARNLELLDRCPVLRAVPGAESPAAGYSTFRWLDRDFGSAANFTRWLNVTGRSGLKLNSNYLFGADPEVWQARYPGRYGIRLNVSVPTAELSDNLGLLRSALDKEGELDERLPAQAGTRGAGSGDLRDPGRGD